MVYVDYTEKMLKEFSLVNEGLKEGSDTTFQQYLDRNGFEFVKPGSLAPERPLETWENEDYYTFDDDGSLRVFCFTNPNRKWDYWTEDVLWEHPPIPIRVSDALEDENFDVFALVASGKWYARGDMGWFCTITNRDENWENIIKEILKSLNPNHYIRLVDCHI